MSDNEEEKEQERRKKSDPPKIKRPDKIKIPRRKKSIVIPPREIIIPDQPTDYPVEEPYQKPKKLNQCQKSPLTLYELSSAVVDKLARPDAFRWSVQGVAAWMESIGLPQYKECIFDNAIDGRRLLMLEDPSKLAEINIHDFEHIKIITSSIRNLYKTDYVFFARSVGLPPRKPLTHCTWFDSRTGPSWGVRVNWSRSDILRWMKIIMPKPVYMDHWDLVWYMKPDFPKVLFGRVEKQYRPPINIPQYVEKEELCLEYKVPRKFRFQSNITDSNQYIWKERRKESILLEKKEIEERRVNFRPRINVVKESRLYTKNISLDGLTGQKFVLARRLLPKKKFLVTTK